MSNYNQAYLESLDPRVRKLFAGTLGEPGVPGTGEGVNTLPYPFAVRVQMAWDLFKSGVLNIDPQIAAEGDDPEETMQTRARYGYLAVPAVGQTVKFMTPPGVSVPGIPAYDPSGMLIPVITDASKLVPFAPIAPPIVSHSLVGPPLNFTSDAFGITPIVPVWAAQKGLNIPEGFPYQDPTTGKTFLYHVLGGSNLMDATKKQGVWLGPQA